jgi:hypothetical protein
MPQTKRKRFTLTPAEFRAKWVEALRSGEYVQGERALETHGEFCCLGVACDLFRQLGGRLSRRINAFGEIEYGPDRDVSALPAIVQKALGLASADGDLRRRSVQVAMAPRDNLADANDAGLPFPEIAALIEGGRVALAGERV